MKTKEELFEENKGLVGKVINKYFRSYCNNYYLLEEIKQVGNMALWISANRFDSSTGHKFSTLSYKVIYGEIQNHVSRFYHRTKRYKEDSKTGININNAEFVSLNNEVKTEEGGIEHIESISYNSDSDIFDDFEDEKLFNEISKIVSEFNFKSKSMTKIDEVIYLKYKGYSQAKIAEMLELDQMGVCRRIKKVKEAMINNGFLDTDLRGGLYIAN